MRDSIFIARSGVVRVIIGALKMKCASKYCDWNSEKFPEHSLFRFPADDITGFRWIDFCQLDPDDEIMPSFRLIFECSFYSIFMFCKFSIGLLKLSNKMCTSIVPFTLEADETQEKFLLKKIFF